jgi:putative oxidoreductase
MSGVLKVRDENRRPGWSVSGVVFAAAHIGLGVVFVLSASGKVASPLAFYDVVLDYGIVGYSLSRWVAIVLPWLELTIGVALIAGVARRGGLLIATLLLSLFTVLQVVLLMQGKLISCACFGVGSGDDMIGWATVLRTSFLMVVAIGLLWTQVVYVHKASKGGNQ